MVAAGAALLTLLAVAHSSLLRHGLAQQEEARGRFRAEVERQAEQVAVKVQDAVNRVRETARSEALQLCVTAPSAANLAAATEALAPFLSPDAAGRPSPLVRAVLRNALRQPLVALGPGAPAASGPGDPQSAPSFIPPPGGDQSESLGFVQLGEGEVHLGISAPVQGDGADAGQLLLVFDVNLAGLVGSRHPVRRASCVLALARMEVGIISRTSDEVGALDFQKVLQAGPGQSVALEKRPAKGRTTRLIGQWEPVGDTPLMLVCIVPRQSALGSFSPGLVMASALLSGGLACALLAALYQATRQQARVTVRNLELAEAELELQDQVREYERADVELRRLVEAVDSAGEVVALVDLRGCLAYVNHAFEQLIGFSAQEALGRSLAEFAPPDEIQRLVPVIERNRTTVWSKRVRCRHRDGDRLRLDVTVSPVRAEETGDLSHYLVMARDVRGDIEVEERVLLARKLEAVARLAGGMAHDFNNVLQVILGYSGEMLESVDNPDLRESLGQIMAAGRRGSEMTARLVAFSRQQVSHRELGAVNDMVRAGAQSIQKRLGPNVDLQLTLAEPLWPVSLDAARISQALTHLAENARDAMDNGGTLTITTANVSFPETYETLTGTLAPGDYVRITVADTGQGISPENLSRLFEPLFSTRQQGTFKGLGLSVVHGTIAQHDGGIVVESTPGQGTVFYLYLPRAHGEKEESQEETSEMILVHTGEGRVILLAEDEEPVRHVAARLLAKAGYEVIETVDGKDAIDRFEQQRDRIDLALLDIVMPELSGAAVAEHIRRTSPSTPILFCSGYAKREMPEGIALPEDIPLIGKPYEPRRLLEAIAQLLG